MFVVSDENMWLCAYMYISTPVCNDDIKKENKKFDQIFCKFVKQRFNGAEKPSLWKHLLFVESKQLCADSSPGTWSRKQYMHILDTSQMTYGKSRKHLYNEGLPTNPMFPDGRTWISRSFSEVQLKSRLPIFQFKFFSPVNIWQALPYLVFLLLTHKKAECHMSYK